MMAISLRRFKMTEQSKTYADNYRQLEAINTKLQNDQHNPEMIDALAPMLEQASKSYQLCKSRIEAAAKFIAEFEKETQSEE